MNSGARVPCEWSQLVSCVSVWRLQLVTLFFCDCLLGGECLVTNLFSGFHYNSFLLILINCKTCSCLCICFKCIQWLFVCVHIVQNCIFSVFIRCTHYFPLQYIFLTSVYKGALIQISFFTVLLFNSFVIKIHVKQREREYCSSALLQSHKQNRPRLRLVYNSFVPILSTTHL